MPEMTAWQARGDVVVDFKEANESHRHREPEGRDVVDKLVNAG